MSLSSPSSNVDFNASSRYAKLSSLTLIVPILVKMVQTEHHSLRAFGFNLNTTKSLFLTMAEPGLFVFLDSPSPINVSFVHSSSEYLAVADQSPEENCYF